MRFKSPLKIDNLIEIEAKNIWNWSMIDFLSTTTHLTVLHLSGSDSRDHDIDEKLCKIFTKNINLKSIKLMCFQYLTGECFSYINA